MQNRKNLARVVSSKNGNDALSVAAGDSVSFIVTADGFSSADGWALEFAVVNAGGLIQFSSASQSDGSFLIEVAATVTANWPAGRYQYQAYLKKGGERIIAMQGDASVTENFSAQSAGFDARSHVQTVLDALEAMLAGKASIDQQSYSIGDRQLSRMTPEEILVWRNKYRQELRAEQQATRIMNGLGGGNRVRVRF